MGSRVVFHGDSVLLEAGLSPATILVENGRIKNIWKGVDIKPEQYDQFVEAGQLVLMPGLIDTHVHVNEPGRTSWEGFSSATRAAAAGGVTTLVDMPLNSIPPTTTSENLRTKLDSADRQCYVDVAFWGGVVPGNQGELRRMVEDGVCGFKCFLIDSGVEEFPSVDRREVETALQQLQGTNSVLLFHAECEVDADKRGLGLKSNPDKYETFLTSRPAEMETKAVKLVAEVCKKYNVRCHIVHLSSAEALAAIKVCRQQGAPLTVETCHHYLNLAAETIPDRATQFKCCPPIREKWNQEELWKALADGHIDMVVSDHSPCTIDLKQPGEKDFMSAWGGIASLQFGLPLFWSNAKRRGFSLQDVNRLLSRNTAKLCGLHKRKGVIQEGFDADFVIWNPNEAFQVEKSGIHYKNKLSPYLGLSLEGVVYKTFVRGELVYEKGRFSDLPLGKLLVCESSI